MEAPPSILRASRSAPSLTALHDACLSLDFDDNLEMLASAAAGGEPMQEGHEEPLKDGASQVYEVPLRDDANQRNPSLRRAVSFSNLNSIHRIQSREDLLDHKSDIWFGSSDISQFAQSEISRRRKIGNTSMSMLCSSVPHYDDDDDDDDDMDFKFMSPTEPPPRG
jgi:hypothetical protein